MFKSDVTGFSLLPEFTFEKGKQLLTICPYSVRSTIPIWGQIICCEELPFVFCNAQYDPRRLPNIERGVLSVTNQNVLISYTLPLRDNLVSLEKYFSRVK